MKIVEISNVIWLKFAMCCVYECVWFVRFDVLLSFFLHWFRSKTVERRWQFVVGLDFVCFNLLKNSPTALIFRCMLSQFLWVAHGLFHHLPKSHQCSKFEFERCYLIGCSTFWYFVDAIFNRWQVMTSAENQLILTKTKHNIRVCVFMERWSTEIDLHLRYTLKCIFIIYEKKSKSETC